jgi:hypothetical protein
VRCVVWRVPARPLPDFTYTLTLLSSRNRDISNRRTFLQRPYEDATPGRRPLHEADPASVGRHGRPYSAKLAKGVALAIDAALAFKLPRNKAALGYHAPDLSTQLLFDRWPIAPTAS